MHCYMSIYSLPLYNINLLFLQNFSVDFSDYLPHIFNILLIVKDYPFYIFNIGPSYSGLRCVLQKPRTGRHSSYVANDQNSMFTQKMTNKDIYEVGTLFCLAHIFFLNLTPV